MITNTFSILKSLTFSVLVVVLLFSVFVPHTHANTVVSTSAQQEQLKQQLLVLVKQLQEKLLILQRLSIGKNGQPAGKNIIHGNSYVEAKERVTLYREVDQAKVAGRQSAGDRGEVVAGPRLIEGQVWWKIAFDEESTGWVEEKYLERIPSVTLSIDTNGDGVQDSKTRLLGEYDTERFFVYPTDKDTAIKYIPKEYELLDMYDGAYTAAQIDKTVDGPPSIKLWKPNTGQEKYFIKNESKSVPISWQAYNVPMNSYVSVEVSAVRLESSGVSGGTWRARSLPGDSYGVYRWDILSEGRIGEGDFKVRVLLKECAEANCPVLATSPYQYFSIRNPK